MKQPYIDFYAEYMELCNATAPTPNNDKQVNQKCQKLRKMALEQAELLKEIARITLDDQMAMDSLVNKYNTIINSLQTCDYGEVVRHLINSWSNQGQALSGQTWSNQGKDIPGQTLNATVIAAAYAERTAMDFYSQLVGDPDIDFTDIP